MKIEKLPSGSYRIRQQYKGRRYTVITDYKPTQKEATQLIAAEFDKATYKHTHMTVKAAAEAYIEAKEAVLSPSTIKGYSSYLRAFPDWLNDMLISDLDSIGLQKFVSEFSKTHDAKYVRNVYGFLTAILGMFCPNTRISVSLPKKAPSAPYIPTDEDVKRILQRAKGTEYEVPLILACYGLRRSEICALDAGDVDRDVLYIRKAKVQDAKNQWIIKKYTKNSSSIRSIVVPIEVAQYISDHNYAFNGYPNSITDWLYNTERKLEISSFSLHKLRHYFCSKMSALGIDEATILDIGGWKTDYVMKRIYRHSMFKDEEARRNTSDKLKNAIWS